MKTDARSPTLPVAKLSEIHRIHTGVPGLDAILGGGLPEFSCNLIAGSPGSGKTTLVQQILFANATAEHPVLYFTVLGEPTLKMLRYQQEFSFFDSARVGSAIHYVNLSEEALARDLTPVLERISTEVAMHHPRFVVVDSLRSFMGRDAEAEDESAMSLDNFMQRLTLLLATWEVTSFLLGEFAEPVRAPVFTVADGVIALSQVTDRNSVVRKMQAVKMRGCAPMPGLHTFRITDDGLQIFPRIPEQQLHRRPQGAHRLATGVPGLDEAMGGGIPSGDAVMLAGPAGSGKTTFATQFVAEGLRRGESVVIVVFEEYPEEYLTRARARNQDMDASIRNGKLKLIYMRPLDLSVDETLAEILEAVTSLDATRVVIDSLSGFEIALAPAFRDDFRESLYRLVGALTATGVTMYMTTEVVGDYPHVRFTTEKVSFITDDIIVQHFVEIDGALRYVLAVHKMRGSAHTHDFRTYEIGPNGATVGGALRNYRGITTGVPAREPMASGLIRAGLTEQEASVYETLVRVGLSSPEMLAERAGLSLEELDPVLARLTMLNYASIATDDGVSYRAVS
jgi:circadian clock protein KaiC